MVAGVVQQVGGEQHGRLLAGILPPVSGYVRFHGDIAGGMNDGHCAIAGVFGDAAADDIDDGGAITVAMPGHNAAGLDRKLAQAELAILHHGRFLREVDGADHGVDNAFGGEISWLGRICHLLVSRAGAGQGDR